MNTVNHSVKGREDKMFHFEFHGPKYGIFSNFCVLFLIIYDFFHCFSIFVMFYIQISSHLYITDFQP